MGKRISILVGLLALGLVAAAPAGAGGSPISYFVGSTDEDPKSLVAFRVVDGEVRDGVFQGELEQHFTSDMPDRKVMTLGGFSETPLRGDRFSCTAKFDARKMQGKARMVLAGQIGDSSASGRFSYRGSNVIATFDSGRLEWAAAKVSRAEFKEAAGFALTVGEQLGERPSC